MPTIQVRDMTVHRRENDLVLATFGRGFYVLDDYSALREITRADAGGRREALPAARRAVLQPDRHGAGRHGRHRPAGGELDRAQSAVRGRLHVFGGEGPASRCEARAHDHRRDRQAGAPARSRQDRRPAARGVEPPRRSAGSRVGDGGRRRARRRAASEGSAAARCRRCRPGAIARRSARWSETRSRPSARRRRSRCSSFRSRAGFVTGGRRPGCTLSPASRPAPRGRGRFAAASRTER